MAKFQCCVCGFLFIFYHIPEDYSVDNYSIWCIRKIFYLHLSIPRAKARRRQITIFKYSINNFSLSNYILYRVCFFISFCNINFLVLLYFISWHSIGISYDEKGPAYPTDMQTLLSCFTLKIYDLKLK